MEKLLISACLVGECCRYDGSANRDLRELLERKYLLIPICPEQAGGLPTPRPPAEIKDGRVVNRQGKDVTEEYRRGAEAALTSATANGCRKALMKERSPSCGCGKIYDGSFSGKLIAGKGIAAELLEANGIEVFGESRLDELL